MDLTTRRRAVFTVLSDYVHDDSLWQAMGQWEASCSAQGQFELNKFLASCSGIEAIAKNRTAIYRQMIALLMAPDNQRLKPDPLREMEQYKKQGFSSVKLSRSQSFTPQDVQCRPAFGILLGELMDAVRSDTQQRLQRYLQDQMLSLQFGQDVRRGMAEWLEIRGTFPPLALDLLSMRKLINTVYIGLCESLGPVQADQILNAAAAKAMAQHPNAGLLL